MSDLPGPTLKYAEIPVPPDLPPGPVPLAGVAVPLPLPLLLLLYGLLNLRCGVGASWDMPPPCAGVPPGHALAQCPGCPHLHPKKVVADGFTAEQELQNVFG